jgi:hypothetical protein
MHLDIDTLRTMTLACSGQAVFYVVRERRRLHFGPGKGLAFCPLKKMA